MGSKSKSRISQQKSIKFEFSGMVEDTNVYVIYKIGEAIISRNEKERERISRSNETFFKVIGNNCNQLLPETND